MADVVQLAERMSPRGSVQDLSGPVRELGANRVFRIWTDDGPRVLKVYGTPARERRELRALEVLDGIEGLPRILDRGRDDEFVWAVFADAGRWNLATLPENTALTKKAGEILRTVHTATNARISNLNRGIDQEWVEIDFRSTVRRLRRYRGKIGITEQLIEAAELVARDTTPFASEPRPAHTDPKPTNFLVDDEGNVTLVNWEWATLAPPEWDLSKAVWLVTRSSGPGAAEALQEGYGRRIDPAQLDRWVVYHAAMGLVFEAERRVGGRSREPYEQLLAELRRAVAATAT